MSDVLFHVPALSRDPDGHREPARPRIKSGASATLSNVPGSPRDPEGHRNPARPRNKSGAWEEAVR